MHDLLWTFATCISVGECIEHMLNACFCSKRKTINVTAQSTNIALNTQKCQMQPLPNPYVFRTGKKSYQARLSATPLASLLILVQATNGQT